MVTARATIKGISPYSQSKALFEPKKPGETNTDYEHRICWMKLHTNGNGTVNLPVMCLPRALAEAARRHPRRIAGQGKATYTKHFEAGILVVEPPDLGVAPDAFREDILFCDAQPGTKGGGRVWKHFPTIDQWSCIVEFHVVDDDVINEEVFTHYLKHTGKFVGIGRFRPENKGYYGRFVVEKVEWTPVAEEQAA